MNDSTRYADFIERALEQLGNVESGIDLSIHKALLEEAYVLITSKTLEEEERVTCEQVYEGLGGAQALKALRDALGEDNKVIEKKKDDSNIEVDIKSEFPEDVNDLLEGSVKPEEKINDSHSQQVNLFDSLVGATCEAKYKGSFFTATIKSFKKDPKGDLRIEVEFFGYKTKTTCSSDDVIVLQPPSLSLLTPGSLCQAIFTDDGIWYDAIVENINNKEITVSYPEYGTQETVRLDRVRLRSNNNSSNTATKNTKKNKEILTPGGYLLPERLLAKDTDTAEIRNRKKSKIQSIKRVQLEQRIEESYRESANSWQSFANKRGKLSLGGRKI